MLRTRRMFDQNLRLRDSASGAVTSSGSATAIAFPATEMYEYKAVINVVAVDVTTGDEAYTFNIQVSDSSGGTYTTVGQRVIAAGQAAIATYEIPLSGYAAESILSGADYIRVSHVLAGTTPSVNYNCWLSPM